MIELKKFQNMVGLVFLLILIVVLVGCSDSDNNPTSPIPSTESDVNIIIRESLMDGQTVGIISEGTWTPEGLQLHGGNEYIRYSIPTTPNGYIEFSAKGFVSDELHGEEEFKAVLFTMWSGDEGYDYENSAFIFELRKFGYIPGRPDATNCLNFRVKSHGEWMVGRYFVVSWDPNTTYRFRVEWGGGQASVYRDGQLVATAAYVPEFTPSNHLVQIGAQPLRQKEAPHDLLISDIIIGIL